MARTLRALVILLALLVAGTGAQTTLFTTADFRGDRDRWTDPAYFLHNTARELTDMQVDNRFGQKGKGADEYVLKSPYPYRTSEEHYQALLAKANGGPSTPWRRCPTGMACGPRDGRGSTAATSRPARLRRR